VRLRAVRAVQRPVEQVRDALREPARWPSWVPGLTEVVAVPKGGGKHEVEIRLRGPRAFRARLEVVSAEEGVRFDLIEGDASALRGEIRADGSAEDCVATAEVEVVFPLAIPGALMAELELVLPRWLSQL
jgi:hypothetical protein